MKSSSIITYTSESERLILRILNESNASQVLDFQKKNAALFEKFEPDRMTQFYTLNYQQTLLSLEQTMFLKKTALRFWVYCKQQPNTIIGTISFNFINQFPFHSCQLGYKFDPDYWHHGFASESIQTAIQIVHPYLNLHRIEALVLASNEPSIRLLERLHFYKEGISRECIQMNGVWTDHVRYVLILPDNDTNIQTVR
ncbi:MAG: GNAT family protein [Lachnospiraceae bacterium]